VGVQFSPDQPAFEAEQLTTERQEESEALASREERERERVAFLATLNEARAPLARGEGRVIRQESMREQTARKRSP
jgi:hypothetical protein